MIATMSAIKFRSFHCFLRNSAGRKHQSLNLDIFIQWVGNISVTIIFFINFNEKRVLKRP